MLNSTSLGLVEHKTKMCQSGDPGLSISQACSHLLHDHVHGKFKVIDCHIIYQLYFVLLNMSLSRWSVLAVDDGFRQYVVLHQWLKHCPTYQHLVCHGQYHTTMACSSGWHSHAQNNAHCNQLAKVHHIKLFYHVYCFLLHSLKVKIHLLDFKLLIAFNV